jgi:hypothetical protein
MNRTLLFVLAAAIVAPGAELRAQDLVDHRLFNRVLEQVWHDGLVDYAALRRQPAPLDEYIAALGGVSADAVRGASRNAQLAFWINAYNACALKLVVEHYPIQKAGFPASLVRSLQGVPDNSIRQIPSTWKREFCPVAGEDRALDEIEHEIVRPMGDPRIHFAINCAARSCPVLAGVAYESDMLDRQLDDAVRRFIARREQYHLMRSANPVLHLNKMLDWYAEDFGGREGVVDFLLRYVPDDDAAYIRGHRPIKVEFEHYDWTLNEYKR